jgi:hypothetical protein
MSEDKKVFRSLDDVDKSDDLSFPGDDLDSSILDNKPGTELAVLSPLNVSVNEMLDGSFGNPNIARYQNERKVMLDFVRSSLVKDVDFGTIHRKIGASGSKQYCPNDGKTELGLCDKCGAKPSLFKAGAEKIASPTGLLRALPTFKKDEDTFMMLGAKPGTICLICEITTMDGMAVLAQGRGCRNVDQDYGDANKTIKMCQKSAQIDATLRLVSGSDLFTLDLEDLPTEAAKDQPTAKAMEYKAPSAPQVSQETAKVLEGVDYGSWKNMPKELQNECNRSKFRLMEKVGVKLSEKDKRNPTAKRFVEWLGEPMADMSPDRYLEKHLQMAIGKTNTFHVTTAKMVILTCQQIEQYITKTYGASAAKTE